MAADAFYGLGRVNSREAAFARRAIMGGTGVLDVVGEETGDDILSRGMAALVELAAEHNTGNDSVRVPFTLTAGSKLEIQASSPVCRWVVQVVGAAATDLLYLFEDATAYSPALTGFFFPADSEIRHVSGPGKAMPFVMYAPVANSAAISGYLVGRGFAG